MSQEQKADAGQNQMLRCGGTPLPPGALPAVVMWDLNAKDAARARTFYGSVFGWDVGSPSNDRVRLATVGSGDKGISGVIGQAPTGEDPNDPPGGRHSGLIMYIKVHNVATYLDRVTKCGGKAIWGPQEIAPGFVIAQFEDPDGTRLGLTT